MKKSTTIDTRIPVTILTGFLGSGKTTLLEGICGLRSIRSGSIWIGDREVTHLPPGQRGIGFVPQDGALFDHLTVRQHLEFALEVRGWAPERRETRSRELAEWLGKQEMKHVRGAPYHPQTQGKIERWHQTLKNRILLENYFLEGELEAAIAALRRDGVL